MNSARQVARDEGKEILATALLNLARDLSLPLTRGTTKGRYVPLKVDRHPLNNALCVEYDCTTFFGDDYLIKKLEDAKYPVEPANIGQHKRHKVFGISPHSLVAHRQLFEEIVKSSVDYCLNPTAGSLLSGNR